MDGSNNQQGGASGLEDNSLFGGASPGTIDSLLTDLLQNIATNTTAGSADILTDNSGAHQPMPQSGLSDAMFTGGQWSNQHDHMLYPGLMGWSTGLDDYHLPENTDIPSEHQIFPPYSNSSYHMPFINQYSTLQQPTDQGLLGSNFTSGSFGGIGTSDYHRLAEEGRDHYASAADQLHASCHISPNLDFTTPSQDSTKIQPRTDSPSAVNEKATISKPSYSDIAKNTSIKQTSTRNHSKQSKHVHSSAGSNVYSKSRSGRRDSSKRKGSRDDSLPSVKPDSHFGLDQFEDPAKLLKDRARRQHSSSGSEGVNRSRQGSCSSIGSGASSEDFLRHSAGASPAFTPPMSRKAEPVPSQNQEKEKSTFSKMQSKKPSESVSDKPKRSKVSSSQTAEKLFFDPTRIFQPRKDQTSSKYVDKRLDGEDKRSETILNNGKPTTNVFTDYKAASTNYINNDLRKPTSKQTNMQSQGTVYSASSSEPNDGPSTETSTADLNHKVPQASDHKPRLASYRRRGDHANSSFSRKVEAKQSSKRARKSKEHSAFLGDLLVKVWGYFRWIGHELWLILWNLGLLLLKCSLFLCMLLLQYTMDICTSVWQFLRSHVPLLSRDKAGSDSDGHSFKDWRRGVPGSPRPPPGLEENIPLPASGEEAMKRLLACRGKDPYSILGVRFQATDDEIKKYYRRQAVLVHPDKNKEPGAEEAFKILGHAFDLIGEPDKRQKYDLQRAEAHETESAMQEFADLLTKLQEKMQEAANTMSCDNCGGKHRRVLTERPWYSARYCDRCATRHSAKEGDVWAESRVLGFLWHYYACMEGKIYDITEWAHCQNYHFKHIQANAHQVIYRIATNTTRRQQNSRQNENDLEDLISQLFHQSGNNPASNGMPQNSFGTGNTSSFKSPHGNQPPQGQSASQSTTNKRRKKKKRH